MLLKRDHYNASTGVNAFLCGYIAHASRSNMIESNESDEVGRHQAQVLVCAVEVAAVPGKFLAATSQLEGNESLAICFEVSFVSDSQVRVLEYRSRGTHGKMRFP
jgi:hypothetical protein